MWAFKLWTFKDVINAFHQYRVWGTCSLPSVPISDDPSSTISHLSLFQSVTLLAYSLEASPCLPAVVLYWTVQGKCTVDLKFFSIFLMCYCVKGILNPLQYSTISSCVIWVSRITLLGFMNKLGLTKAFSEWILFVWGDLLYLHILFLCCVI